MDRADREHGVTHAEAADEFDGLDTEGAAVVGTQFATGHEDPVAVARGERVGDGQGVGDDEQVGMALQSLRDVGRRRADIEEQGVAVLDDVGDFGRNPALGFGVLVHALAEGLFVLRFDQVDPAVYLLNLAAGFERLDVAADGLLGHAEPLGQEMDAGRAAGKAHFVQNLAFAVVAAYLGPRHRAVRLLKSAHQKQYKNTLERLFVGFC